MDTALSGQDAATFERSSWAQKNVEQANENLARRVRLSRASVTVSLAQARFLGPGAKLTGLGGEGAGLLSRTGASMGRGRDEGQRLERCGGTIRMSPKVS